MFELVDGAPQSAVIKVIGVGGGGGNAINHMLKSQYVEGVEFICREHGCSGAEEASTPRRCCTASAAWHHQRDSWFGRRR